MHGGNPGPAHSILRGGSEIEEFYESGLFSDDAASPGEGQTNWIATEGVDWELYLDHRMPLRETVKRLSELHPTIQLINGFWDHMQVPADKASTPATMCQE